MIKMLKFYFSALCCRQSLDIAEFADFLFHALLAGSETKFALQENLCPARYVTPLHCQTRIAAKQRLHHRPWETGKSEKTWRDLHVYRNQRTTTHGKHNDMCELGDKGSVASVTRYKRPRADSSHGASSMLFHHSPCQNLHWRNFTQAVRHLAWATDQQKQQNIKESRI